MEILVEILFVANVILAIADAAVAYSTAPHFVAAINPDPDRQAAAVRNLRNLLPLLVALYVVLNCQAHALRHPGYLVGLTCLLVGDILLQRYLGRKRDGMVDGGE